jgi:hypothetical protein
MSASTERTMLAAAEARRRELDATTEVARLQTSATEVAKQFEQQKLQCVDTLRFALPRDASTALIVCFNTLHSGINIPQRPLQHPSTSTSTPFIISLQHFHSVCILVHNCFVPCQDCWCPSLPLCLCLYRIN